MEPENLKFGGGVSQTFFNPLIGVVVLMAVVIICFGSRNKALVAFLSAAIMIPMDQVLVLGALHFPVIRILVMFGLARIFWAKLTSGDEIFSGGVNGIDKAVLVFGIFTAIDGVLLWKDPAAAVFQAGNLISVFGIYFLLRFLIREDEDVQLTYRTFARILAVIAVFMAYERVTATNLIYGMLGGARAAYFGTAFVRDNQIRAVGPFGHPILAGTFGAILLPLFVGLLWKDRKNRNIAILGIVASTVAAVAANSSTSLLGFAAGLFALCLWPARQAMRPIRWAIVIVLTTLHLAMNGPVWALIQRIDVTGSSSSYHRYELVNQCIRHFSEWFLVGTKVYADWGFDMWDLSNQYVAIAETAGLIPFLAFLAMIVFGFKYAGKARKAAEGDKPQELFLWAIGAAMFANVVAYFGTSYWDQTMVAWYALLATIPVAVAAKIAQPVPQPKLKMTKPGLGLRPRLVTGPARGSLSNS
jgi:hypothetical protein